MPYDSAKRFTREAGAVLTRLLNAPAVADSTSENGSLVLPIAVASAYPVKRWWGTEVLNIKGARLSRLNDGASVLFNHDTDKIVGSHVRGSARVDGDNVLRASIRLSPATQQGKDAIALYRGGHLTKISSGYAIHKVKEQVKRGGREVVSRYVDASVFERAVRSESAAGGSLVAFQRSIDDSAGRITRAAEDDCTYLMEDWEPLESSMVAAPADPTVGIGRSASGTQITEPSDPGSPASGQRAAVASTGSAAPGASGHVANGRSPDLSTRSQGRNMKPLQEQLNELATQMTTADNRQREMMKLTETEGNREFNSAEESEYQTLVDSKRKLKHQMRKLELDLENISTAVEVTPGVGSRAGASGYIHVRSSDKDEDFKGQNFVRKIIAKAVAKLDSRSVISVAEERWGKTNPTLVRIIRANEVAGGGTGSGEWGQELTLADTRYTGDFIEFLYAATVYDKLPFTPIPDNVVIKGQDGQATGYWTGESKSIPATTVDFSDVTLTSLEVGALAVVSNQLLRRATPAAEGLVRDALVQASGQRVDTTLFSANAASAGVSPAGLLNGLTAPATFVSSGTDAAALRADILDLYAPFIAARNARGLQLVMGPSLAKAIGLMVNSLGQTEFPGLNADGGVLLGDKVVTGDNVPTGDMILLSPKDIYKIGDSGVQVDLSTEAMIEQSSAPTGATDTPVAASQVFTSMFQANSTAIRVLRYINFAKRRASAVSFVSHAYYGGAAS